MNKKINISARYDSELARWFKQNYVPGDALISRAASDLVGLPFDRQLLFDSSAQALIDVPKLPRNNITQLGYNFEHRPQTPPDEQANPVSAVVRLKTMATQRGLALIFAPDRYYGLELAESIAPLANIWALQLQGFGDDVKSLHDYADGLIYRLRRANPKIKLTFQFRQDVAPDKIAEIVNGFPVTARCDTVSLLYEPGNSGAVIQLAEVIR